MSILSVHEAVRTSFRAVLIERYGLRPDVLPDITIEYPPNRKLGDLAVTVAFELARRLRKAPRLIGQEIVEALGPIAGVAHAEATPSGYVNLFLDRAPFITAALSGSGASAAPARTGKRLVEHTAINPNKAAHVGHLRNAALGDTLVRLLRFQGYPVEVQNYIDDTGVQLADVVVGFRELEGKTLNKITAIAEATRFDYHCWDLYARVTEWYEADTARLEIRARTLRDLEHGDNENAAIATFIADRIVRCHLATMDRLNVEYDLLSWEGDILKLQFWTHAFEVLKTAGAVFLQTEGPQNGCWVMPIEEVEAGADALKGADTDAGNAEDTRTKVIVRSDGTVTYVGKDIAYQLWKFGLLGRDFHYRPFGVQESGRALWATSATAVDASDTPPPFGGAAAVYNVIDTRQTYLQELLKQALTALEHPDEAERSVHFSYEMVALSHTTAAALGYDIDVDGGKPFVEVSGRKGLGVKADDLLDRMIGAARGEVVARNAHFTPAEADRTARIIAIAAVRYFMIKYSRGKVIVFDIDEALSFEGESGPYLQYAAVRAANILQKLRVRQGTDDAALAAAITTLSPDALSDPEGTDLWALVLDASRLDEVAEQAVRTLELSTMAKYTFGLAQAFNAFYHRYPVIKEERTDVRLWRAVAVRIVRQQLTRALDLMGCAVPTRM